MEAGFWPLKGPLSFRKKKLIGAFEFNSTYAAYGYLDAQKAVATAYHYTYWLIVSFVVLQQLFQKNHNIYR